MSTPSFADLLRRYRTVAGLTQEELAERAGLSARAVSALERGVRRAPYRETVRLLADALGLDDVARLALEAAARRPRSAGLVEDEGEEAVSSGAAAAPPSRWHGPFRAGAAADWPPQPEHPSGEGEAPPRRRLSIVPAGRAATRSAPLYDRPLVRLGIAAALLVGLLIGGLIGLHQRGVLFATARAGTRGPRAPATTPVLSLYAGTGEAGHANGPRMLAQFSSPLGVNVTPEGSNLIVSDPGNNFLRHITGPGLVSDYCGSGTRGYADGPCATAQFADPSLFARGPDGTVYVVDNGNLRIRAISPVGVVRTLAGSGVKGFADGEGDSAQFGAMGGIDVDQRTGILYQADYGNHRIRRITPGGIVTTFAGSGAPGYLDGPATVAQFNAPRGVSVDTKGNVYVQDAGNHRLRKISPDGVVSTLAGSGEVGFVDGPGTEARFGGGTISTTIDLSSGNLFMMDAGNRRIRKITPEGAVSTVLEVTDHEQTPFNIRMSPTGDAYLSDPAHHRIYKIGGLSPH